PEPSPNPRPIPPPLKSHKPNPAQPTNIVTRSKNNISKQKQNLNLHLTLHDQQPTEPTNITQSLQDPNWRAAMQAEYDALLQNGTWDLVLSSLIKFTEAVSGLISCLAKKFSLKDLDTLNYFLGVEVLPSSDGLFMMQRKYIKDLLSTAGMADTKPTTTLLCATTPLIRAGGTPLPSSTEYRQLVGSLQYLNLTLPDVAFTTNKLSQFMKSPTSDHWFALKCVLRYLAGTLTPWHPHISHLPANLSCLLGCRLGGR
ncbi:hypothetical protein V2J09_003843, partial [Rumex salicifolius]